MISSVLLTCSLQLEQPYLVCYTQASYICISPDFYSLEYFRRDLSGQGQLRKRGGGDEPDWDDVFRPLVSRHHGGWMSREAAAVTVLQNYQRVN